MSVIDLEAFFDRDEPIEGHFDFDDMDEEYFDSSDSEDEDFIFDNPVVSREN